MGAGTLDPGEGEAAPPEVARLLSHGVDIRKGLTGVVNLGLEVDDRDLGVLREGLEVQVQAVLFPALSPLREPDPYRVQVFGECPGSVPDVLHLVTSKGVFLDFIREGIEVLRSGESQGCPSQLDHRDGEAHPGPEALGFEDHSQGLPLQ